MKICFAHKTALFFSHRYTEKISDPDRLKLARGRQCFFLLITALQILVSLKLVTSSARQLFNRLPNIHKFCTCPLQIEFRGDERTAKLSVCKQGSRLRKRSGDAKTWADPRKENVSGPFPFPKKYTPNFLGIKNK